MLRKQGYSINEISRQLGVSKGSVSLWVRDIVLSKKAQNIIRNKLTAGQLKSREVHRKQTEAKENAARSYAQKVLRGISMNRYEMQLMCAMIYWCEGNKSTRDLVFFTNSDPKLIRTFLYLFRESFDVDETKFRVCMHLHDHHNEERQLKFWSKTTNIPKEQFLKSYIKQNTKKRIRENYQGCVQVRYYDVTIARKLLSLAREYMKKYGSIG